MDAETILQLWRDIDRDNDGKITREQLKAGLRLSGVPFSEKGLSKVMSIFDDDGDGSLSYPEFLAFIQLQQYQLVRAFAVLDSNHTGKISARDVELFAAKMNVNLSHAEIAQLLSHVSHGREGHVSRSEFTRHFLALTDGTHAEGVFEAWLKESAIGSIPLSDPEGRCETPSWVLLAAGALAGMVSRTLTAPADRIKTLLQVSPHRGGTPQAATASSLHTAPTTGSQPAQRLHVVGIIQGARAIHADGGLAAFWRGNGINLIKVVPETAARFWAYERLKRALAEDPENISLRERFIAGASAGVVAQTVIYPLEVAKTRFALSSAGQYGSLLQCLRSIIQHEGPRGLYRGLFASLVGIVPYSGTDLTVFSMLKDAYEKNYPDAEPSIPTLLACGATATTCGQVVSYPLQLIRTRLQAQGMPGRPDRYAGMLDCFRKTVAEEGILGLYRGIGPNFLKSVPAMAISYAVFEAAKRALATAAGSRRNDERKSAGRRSGLG